MQYFICRTVRLGYAGTTTNLRIVLSTPKKSLPESKILNPQKSFDHPRLLKSGVPSMVIYIILQVQEIKLKVAKLRALAICQNRMARPILLYREFHCLGNVNFTFWEKKIRLYLISKLTFLIFSINLLLLGLTKLVPLCPFCS